MTELYLIRHTQAEGNLYRQMQGFWDGKVTELGKQEIGLLAERFREVNVDAVYSSDLSRAILTGEGVRRYHPGVPLKVDPRLREINVGPWESRFFGDVAWEQPELMNTFENDPEHWSIPGAETFPEVRRRAYGVLLEILEKNDGRTIAVTTHSVTIRCILSAILNVPLTSPDAVPVFGNTGVGHFYYENGKFTIDYVNDMSHLESLHLPPWNRVGSLRAEWINPAEEQDMFTAAYRDCWIAAHGSEQGFVAEGYLAGAIDRYQKDPKTLMRLYDRETPVGLLALDPERMAERDFGWISLLYLDKEHRNLGIGAQVLGRAVNYYLERGRMAVCLNVSSDNLAALRFYEKWGFRTFRTENYSSYDIYTMGKNI